MLCHVLTCSAASQSDDHASTSIGMHSQAFILAKTQTKCHASVKANSPNTVQTVNSKKQCRCDTHRQLRQGLSTRQRRHDDIPKVILGGAPPFRAQPAVAAVQHLLGRGGKEAPTPPRLGLAPASNCHPTTRLQNIFTLMRHLCCLQAETGM